LQKLIPNFMGQKDNIVTQNCPLVVRRTHDNAEKAECTKMQVSEDKRQRGTPMSAQSTILRSLNKVRGKNQKRKKFIMEWSTAI